MAGVKSDFVEDRVGRVWDKCIIDTTVKLGGGILLGSVLTLLFFQRRKWPIFAGAGFGVGMAYANCEREMNNIIKRS
ncbi:MICOS complex subunit Mic10-like [Chrysoperla carnea]|uniref:MICOS complex subunit Mic10-like n=1 Tax=Chrysoperla carnea TaxID=189513 RepID=UPI001D07E357|nr:MICOS complex subunit Mic10-like [Chrysoperla carnea]